MPVALLALLLAAQDPQEVARKVQATYERTQDLEARFTQTYTYAAFGRSQVSKGLLRVKKPGKLRWDYETPGKKTVVVDGSRLVQWEPDANQAYVDDHFDASAMSAAVAFLLGKGSLAKEFTLSLDAKGRLVGKPRKADPRVAQVAFEVGPEGEVLGAEVTDAAGNRNDLRLESPRRNQGLKDELFEVKLPEGTRRLQQPGKDQRAP